MIVDSPGGEWVIKIGPVARTNHAGSRKVAEEGAARQALEDARALLEMAKPMIPLLLKGAMCVGDCEPEADVEGPEPQVVSYQLPDGKWFSIAEEKAFGVKLVCRKPKKEQA